MELRGQNILVTGASQGIGRAMARELMAKGARVVVHYNSHRQEALDLLAEYPESGSVALQAAMDKPEPERTGHFAFPCNQCGDFPPTSGLRGYGSLVGHLEADPGSEPGCRRIAYPTRNKILSEGRRRTFYLYRQPGCLPGGNG